MQRTPTNCRHRLSHIIPLTDPYISTANTTHSLYRPTTPSVLSVWRRRRLWLWLWLWLRLCAPLAHPLRVCAFSLAVQGI
mmetsp:Transcript_30698/g.76235  ORF Transcript_30698/g.76235 Transcript_30698/m.76235 type:complete len:80 (+) Transcript_30698:156-395(+)